MNITSLHAKKRPPVVLNEACQQRITHLNNVSRELKSRGHEILRQELYPVRWRNRPAIEIKRKDASIVDVICSAERTWFDAGRGYAIYRGVTVLWSACE